MIKAIVFDLWGTLFHFEGEYGWKYIARLLKQEPNQEFFKLYQEITNLKVKSIKEYAKDLVLRTHNSLNNELLQNITLQLNPPSDAIQVYSDVIPLLKELKHKYKLGILTNSEVFSYQRLNEKFHIEDFFDGIIKSFEVNAIKPSRVMFQMILDKLGENRDTTIMVGNSFKNDVRSAEHFGMVAVLVDRNDKHPMFERRISSLNELSKFLN